MHVHAVGNGTSSAAGAEGTVAKELEEAKKKLRACFSVKSFPSFYTDEIVDCWANANVSGTHPDLANQWEIPPPALHKRLNRFVLGSTTRGAEGNVCQTTPLATGRTIYTSVPFANLVPEYPSSHDFACNTCTYWGVSLCSL